MRRHGLRDQEKGEQPRNECLGKRIGVFCLSRSYFWVYQHSFFLHLFSGSFPEKALVIVLSVVRIKIPDGKKTALHVKENKLRRLHIYMSI